MKSFVTMWVVALMAISSHAQQFDGTVDNATITEIEVSYLPELLYIKIDKSVATCVAGDYLVYSGPVPFPNATVAEKQAAVRTLAQLLQSQKLAGAPVRVYAKNKLNNTCSLSFVHLK